MFEYDMRASHQRTLLTAALNTQGVILELGVGHYSTPILQEVAREDGRKWIGYDSDRDWAIKFGATYVGDWARWEPRLASYGLCFIDCSPAEERVRLLKRIKADVFVLHDTETTEAPYFWRDVLDQFPFRWDDKTHPVWTTVVSDCVPVEVFFT